jgi:DNA-directed RNA polymerase specialized sigma24 family protein
MADLAERVEIDEAALNDIVDPTARAVFRKFGDHVELEDLRQEAAIWWYSPAAQRHLPAYLAQGAPYTVVRRSMYRELARYAEKEKAGRLGYNPADQYRYTPSVIVELLPLAMDPEGVPEPLPGDGGPSAKGNKAEGGDVLAALVDVRRALHALAEDDLHFLTLVTDHASDWARVAAYTGTLPDSARRRYARIAERMARWLAREEFE